MLCGKALAAPVFLLGCCSALWRYTTNGKNYIIFNTRTTIHLEYEGKDFLEWDTPGVCVVKNKTSEKTIMYCSTQGFHSIKPIVAGKISDQEERFLYVDRSRDCFLWYFQASTVENEGLERILVWVYDPESASDSEQAGNASEPSINSRTLSMQFLNMGQEPVIQSLINFKKYFPKKVRDDGVWEIFIPRNKLNIFMIIKGNPVAFQDCFISNYFFTLTYTELILGKNPNGLPITAKNEKDIFYDWMACFPETIVTVSFWETLYTENAFNSSKKIRAPLNIMSDEERHSVEDISITEDGIFFLIQGSIYLKTSYDFKKIDEKFGLPPDIIGTETRSWCWPEFRPKEGLELSEIIMWTKTEFYLGYKGLRFYRLISVKDLVNYLDIHTHEDDMEELTINHAVYTSEPTGIALMMNIFTSHNTSMLHLVFYNEDSLRWSLQDFALIIPTGEKINSIFMYSALPNLIIWDEHTVYYSYQNFSNDGYLQTNSGEEKLSTVSKTSTIHQIFIDYFGNGVIKMYNNIMLYFKIDITHVSILPEWQNPQDQTLFFFNPSGNLYIVNLKNGTAKREEYPLTLELSSSTHKEHIHCPFITFETNVRTANAFMDKRDELILWSQVVYPENNGVFSIVETYGPKILRERRSVEYEIALGICTKNLTVTFYQEINYEVVEDYIGLQKSNMGNLMIQLRPSQFTKACPLSNKAIQVFVGCYPERFISVKGYKFSPCEDKNITYVIDKKHLRNDPPEDKYVEYNVSEFGCPIKIHLRNAFQPTLELYDKDSFVEEVKANFIIWEIHGRTDYSFNLTMGKSGCVNEAQTWKSMIENNKHLPIEEVWGPENYRDCFSYSIGKPGDLRQPYEIINLTNDNHIIWTETHVGIYVFRVKIIDPNYSFCNFTTTFAIETVGLVPRPDPSLVAFFLSILMTVVLAFLLVSYFRYLRIFRKFIYEPNQELKDKKK